MTDNSPLLWTNASNELFHEDFEKICRSCLSRNANVNLFFYIHEGILLSEIYNSLSLLECTENDSLPNRLCDPCASFVMQFYAFKKRAIDSDLKLQNVIVKKKEEGKEISLNINQPVIRESNNDHNNDDVKLESINHDQFNADDSAEDQSENEIKQKPSRINHKRTMSKKQCNLTCAFCDNTFNTYMEYKIHRKKEADRRRKKHPCPVCQKLISTYKLKDHINSHTKERPYQCGVCGEKFRFRSSLTRHNFRHIDKKPHECPICGKGFIQAPTLTDHLRTHTGEKSFICNVCGKCFVTKHALRNHINMHKIRDVNADFDSDFSCKVCHKIFTSQRILTNHLFVHNEKKFLCNECGKKFSTKALLDSHLKIHSGIKPYACEICKKSFSQKNSLQKHALTHTGEKPVVCIICEKRFSQKGHLTYHMRRHSGERPYTCTYCEKTFNHTGSLKVHIRIHTGEKPFVCDICSKGFYDSSSMKKHRKIHDELRTDLNIKMELQ